MSSDSIQWEVAIEHYHADRLIEAWEIASQIGIGDDGRYLRWFRVIEAEATTRLRSVIVPLNPWLRLEYVPSQTQGLEGMLSQEIRQVVDWVGDRLHWDHSSPTLVTLLNKESDTPWAVSPYGYCADKNDFDKICLPDYLIDDMEEFRQAVAHEYAHVVSLGLANGYAPRWLEEAVSVLTENLLDEEAIAELSTGEWMSPGELEMVLSSEREDDEEGEDRLWLAYQQAGAIGRVLEELGPDKLPELLRRHSDEGSLKNLWRAMRGRSRTDVALESTYGMSVQCLFDLSFSKLGEFGRVPG